MATSVERVPGCTSTLGAGVTRSASNEAAVPLEHATTANAMNTGSTRRIPSVRGLMPPSYRKPERHRDSQNRALKDGETPRQDFRVGGA
jgi:hypothetical protein